MEALGAELPFRFVDSTFSRGRRVARGWGDWGVRVVVKAVLAGLWLIEVLGVMELLGGLLGWVGLLNRGGIKVEVGKKSQ